MKYFLTGATGFVGSHLAALLRKEGHEVRAVVRHPERAASLQAIGVEVFAGDVTEKDSMRAAMQGCDGVFHVAGWYQIGLRDKTPGWRINVDGTRNVLELMRELNIPKGVYTSTLAVNSDTQGEVVDESFHFSGTHISEYDRTKAAAHDVAQQMIDQGLPLVILMPGLIYGPGGTSMSDQALRMLLKKKLPALPAKVAYNWAHVDDIAQAHYLAMEKAAPGSTYIVGGPIHSLVDAYALASDIAGVPKPMVISPVWLRLASKIMTVIEKVVPVPPMYSAEALRVQAGVTYLGDNSKAKRELGYQPRTLEEGLRQTIAEELADMQSR